MRLKIKQRGYSFRWDIDGDRPPKLWAVPADALKDGIEEITRRVFLKIGKLEKEEDLIKALKIAIDLLGCEYTSQRIINRIKRNIHERTA